MNVIKNTNSIMDKIVHSYNESESRSKDECIKKEPSYLMADSHQEETESLPIRCEANVIDDVECNDIKQEKSICTESCSKVKDETALSGCFKEECSMKKEVIVDLKEEFKHVNKSIHTYEDIQLENIKNEDIKYDIDIKNNNLDYKVDNSSVQSTSMTENINQSNMRITRSMASIAGHSESNFEEVKKKYTFKHSLQKRTEDYECIKCNKVFISESLLRNHMSVHESIMYMCDICVKPFNTKYHLSSHIKLMHMDPRNYVCQECNKCFTIKCNLRRHVNSQHRSKRNYVCYDCGKNIQRKDNLIQHMKSAHIENCMNRNIYTCLQCSKIFHLKKSLVRHYEKGNSKHNVVKQYYCNECDKVYSWKYDLVRHIDKVHMNILHSDIKIVVCNYCNKTFCDKKHLVKHIDRIHKMIKEYECVFCRKTFFEKNKLKRHLKSRKHKNI